VLANLGIESGELSLGGNRSEVLIRKTVPGLTSVNLGRTRTAALRTLEFPILAEIRPAAPIRPGLRLGQNRRLRNQGERDFRGKSDFVGGLRRLITLWVVPAKILQAGAG